MTNRFFILLDQGLSNLMRDKSSNRSIYLIIVGTYIPRLAAILLAFNKMSEYSPGST
ncbi:MAG: hypothetical protein O7C59_03545 [Rickettsia endosymbiont of Ixodes persulcatus]|nr:hypothetical protein [Rickettsia endosymbiont of Ixodes persulcatus]